MDFNWPSFLVKNIPQKIFAFFAAVAIWLLVHQGITVTKTFSNVPIRVVNLPSGMTVPALMPNGIYQKRMTLTLTGTQEVLEGLEPGDFEILLDAKGRVLGEWPLHISKSDLKSLNSDITLSDYITEVSHGELILHLVRITTASVPVEVVVKKEFSPKGYRYLDVWPTRLMQTLTGPEEEIEKIVKSGIVLEIDLSAIPLNLEHSDEHSLEMEDEVSVFVPQEAKQFYLPQISSLFIPLNDPDGKDLRVNFLKEGLIPLNHYIPILLFFPVETNGDYNPLKNSLQTGDFVAEKNGIFYLDKVLYISGASRRFVDIIRGQLSITINVTPRLPLNRMAWNVQIVNPRALEDRYVNLVMGNLFQTKSTDTQKELFVRARFREYSHALRLYTGKDRKLQLDCRLEGEKIRIMHNIQPSILEKTGTE